MDAPIKGEHEVIVKKFPPPTATIHALTAALENIYVGVLITDPRQPDNPIVFVNSAFTSITGYASEEALGRNPRFLAHSDADPLVQQSIREAIAARQPFKGKMLNRRKDGSIFHNSLIITPVFDDKGELTNFIGVAEDVTIQDKFGEEFLKNVGRFKSMVSNVPGMIYRACVALDGTFEYLYIGEGCRTLFGIDPDQFRTDGTKLSAMVHPEDLEDYAKAEPELNVRQIPWRWQGRFILPNGDERVILCQNTPEPQDNGDTIWDGLLTDITDLVLAEKKAANLAAIVEGSIDAVIGKTLDGIVTSWNKAAEKIYGYTAEEMIGQPIERLLPADRPGEAEDLLKRIRRGEQVQSYETMRLAKDGTILDVALTISPIRDSVGNVTGAATIAQDIRRRKDAEVQIQRQLTRIQALRNIDMAITASMDLRVTLNVLLDQVTTHLNVDCASVLRNNPRTQRLEYIAGRGFRTDEVTRARFRIGEGLPGRAAQERRILSVPDLRQNQTGFMRVRLVADEGFVSYWVAPLITKGRVEGVLEVFHRSPLHCDSDWLHFFEVLAGQAAIAIENATLFNDLQNSNVELHVAYDSTLEGWSKALDLRDKETEGHTLRVTDATMILARAMNLSDDETVHIRRGALLHDIGKMGVPDSILLKPGPLTAEEWIVMKKHPVYAYELLSPIPFLRPALDIPYCHHEKWDGSGYPRGLKGDQIPLSARVFAVADVWDALCSPRPYRAAWSPAKVRDHIAEGRGLHFDPRIVEMFLDIEL